MSDPIKIPIFSSDARNHKKQTILTVEPVEVVVAALQSGSRLVRLVSVRRHVSGRCHVGGGHGQVGGGRAQVGGGWRQGCTAGLLLRASQHALVYQAAI